MVKPVEDHGPHVQAWEKPSGLLQTVQNLLVHKAGEVMTNKGGKVMSIDETLSPTFKDAIVL